LGWFPWFRVVVVIRRGAEENRLLVRIDEESFGLLVLFFEFYLLVAIRVWLLVDCWGFPTVFRFGFWLLDSP
jgi:hypothetical protein